MCDLEVPEHVKGRPAIYCSPRCRKRAQRAHGFNPGMVTKNLETVTKCTTIFEGAMIDRHLPNRSAPGAYDSRGNYWCAHCQSHYQMMCNGAILEYPEVYYFPDNPPGEQLLMVHAGAENWKDYAAIRGRDAIQAVLGKTWELLRKEKMMKLAHEPGIYPPTNTLQSVSE